MHEAAVQADLDPDRLSFIKALRVIRRGVTQFQQTAREQHPRLYKRMLREIASHTRTLALIAQIQGSLNVKCLNSNVNAPIILIVHNLPNPSDKL